MNSVFRTIDRNHDGILNANEAANGYGMLSRLYDETTSYHHPKKNRFHFNIGFSRS